jgi:hypothetical protein
VDKPNYTTNIKIFGQIISLRKLPEAQKDSLMVLRIALVAEHEHN